MPFTQFGLSPEILRAVQTMRYTVPTPIQEKAIPRVLEGKDLMGSAQTGTGKTAAFALPILQRLSAGGVRRGRRPVRALVLTPTRELAVQIGESFGAYAAHTGLRHTVVYGGVSQRPQEQALGKGVDILVATPGRLLDLMGQKLIDLSVVEIFVLDEADRMLDMGFIPDIRRVIEKLPGQRQTLMFSATMPYDIVRLADTILRDPVRVSVAPVSAPAEMVEHRLYYVEKPRKTELLKHLLADDSIRNALVFTRTRHGADRVERILSRANIRAEAIHGDKSQGARERALSSFKKGAIRVLVATDIAARGLDIVELSHVVNYDFPNEPEAYVHRIGRTGRAGLSGIAITFCAFDERPLLAEVERLIQKHLTVVPEHPFASPARPGTPTSLEKGRPQPRNRPYMISVDASFLSARPAPAAAPPSRTSRHAEAEARPTAGPGGRKSGHRDIVPPGRASRR
ncbi:MAG: DEAD/DEAH box helicase [Deltaproteobacteria bacterium]|nr:MAG: DEAD/DEAH box helicase [Deltaproteobacteria bacterium]